jgi:NAD(P)H-dependent flavin oxidoreductase YrpB (nitropropane dioxygenase family)
MSVPAPRTSPLAGLGITSPVLAAPMAGGPTTARLVTAAARSGGMGFLPADRQRPPPVTSRPCTCGREPAISRPRLVRRLTRAENYRNQCGRSAVV